MEGIKVLKKKWWIIWGENSIFERISKALVLLGVLFFATYFLIRMYVIYRGGGPEFYGVSMFLPDRILIIFAISVIIVSIGVILFTINKKMIESRKGKKIINE